MPLKIADMFKMLKSKLLGERTCPHAEDSRIIKMMLEWEKCKLTDGREKQMLLPVTKQNKTDTKEIVCFDPCLMLHTEEIHGV